MTEEGKSIRTTAIITFSLIGIPLLFTKCSNSDMDEKHHTTHSKTFEHINTQKEEHDISYTKRDQEMALASYTKDMNASRATIPSFDHNEHIEIGGGEPLNLNPHETKLPAPIKVLELKKDIEISETSNVTKTPPVVKTTQTIIPVAKASDTPITKVPQAVAATHAIQTVKKVDINITDVPKVTSKVVKATQVESNVPTATTEISEPKPVDLNLAKAPQALKLVSTTEKITVPQASTALDIEKAELARKLDSKIRSEKILQDKIVHLKDENKHLLNQLTELTDSQIALKKKIADEIANREKEIEKLQLKEASLEEKRVLLSKENSQLIEKINKLEDLTQQANKTVDTDKQEISKLFSQQKELKSTLSNQEKKEQEIAEEKAQLEGKIAKLLAIAKEATAKVTQEQAIQIKEREELILKQQSLEQNLSAELEKEARLKEENLALQTKITTLLSIAEKATAKVTQEQEAEDQEYHQLLQRERELEANLSIEMENETLLMAERVELENKITKLLSMAEMMSQKGTELQQEKNGQIQSLLTKKIDLESNLTNELEKEKQLQEENQLLQTKITTLLSIAKEATAKIKDEQKSQTEEFNLLLDKQQELESNLSTELKKEAQLNELNSKLQVEIEELKQKIEEANANDKTQELQTLMSQQQNLEANLSSELEKEAQLKAENEKLQASIAELTAQVEEAKANDKTQELELLLKQEQEKIKQIIQAKEEAEKASQERSSLLSKEKAATAAALLLVKETKATLDKIEKEKAEALSLAKQKAKEAEEKAKEAAEAKAKQEQLQESRKVEAKQQLSNAFSLTHVEFKYNSMDLTDQSKRLLNDTAKVMKQYSDNFHFIIQGHTDNTGRESYNVKLSGQRANQVKKYLVSQGVPAEILSTEGIGSAQPIADNNTKAGRLQNRRVVFQIVEN